MKAPGPIGGTRRGQTTLDFAVGISVFILTVAFVFSFIPGMIAPFSESTQEETAAADRIATSLATGTLTGDRGPYVLDRVCTDVFFKASATSPPPDCPFDQTVTVNGQEEPTFTDRIGVSERLDVQVVLTGDPSDDGTHDTLCWDDSAKEVTEESIGPCTTVFEIGTGTPPGTYGSESTGRQTVSIAGVDALLEVVVW